MKNNLFLFYALLIILSCLTSCNDAKKDNKTTRTSKEVTAPSQIISIDEAKSFYDNYSEKRAKLIEGIEGPFEDGSDFSASRFGDYDLQTIKDYISYLEQQADEAGVEIETLRFYFSTYPDKKDFPDKKEIKHPRQNSFFILPTMKVDTTNLGFYIKTEQGKKEALLIRDYPGFLNSKQDTLYRKSITEQSLIMNEGSMSPPPKNNSDFN